MGRTTNTMASCPFRRTSSHSLSNGGMKRALTSRQSSIQISTVEELEEEDKNTLNLKHLNSAILLLTAPPVSTNICGFTIEKLTLAPLISNFSSFFYSIKVVLTYCVILREIVVVRSFTQIYALFGYLNYEVHTYFGCTFIIWRSSYFINFKCSCDKFLR